MPYLVHIYLPTIDKNGDPIIDLDWQNFKIVEYAVHLAGGCTLIEHAKGFWKSRTETISEPVQILELVVEHTKESVLCIAETLAQRIKETFCQETVLYHIAEIECAFV